MPGAYYNERDPYAAQWLRNLIAAGHIAPGVVDERSITEIDPDELRGFTQCHFFAGIGVWSHALRRAGWADDRPVWTGSCPCQPFSAAGKQARFDDERHLWPVWFRLIAECRPAVVLGEQVASALDWLDLVSADLEGAGYAFGASDLCAAGFDGAHIRQRLYFVALAEPAHARIDRSWQAGPCRWDEYSDGGGFDGLADALRSRTEHDTREGLGAQTASHELDGSLSGQRLRVGLQGSLRGMADAGSEGRRQERADAGRGGEGSRAQGLDERSGGGGALRGLVDTDGGHAGAERQQRGRQHGLQPQDVVPVRSGAGGGERHADRGMGADAPMLGRTPVDWLFCRDGKWRPVEPGTFPLADAVAGRVGRLRAYGNALDAETAAQFCGAVIDTLSERLAA